MEERGHLKDFFEGDNLEPQNDLWAPIQAGIEPKRKRRLFFWWLLPIALVGIGLCIRSQWEPLSRSGNGKPVSVKVVPSQKQSDPKLDVASHQALSETQSSENKLSPQPAQAGNPSPESPVSKSGQGLAEKNKFLNHSKIQPQSSAKPTTTVSGNEVEASSEHLQAVLFTSDSVPPSQNRKEQQKKSKTQGASLVIGQARNKSSQNGSAEQKTQSQTESSLELPFATAAKPDNTNSDQLSVKLADTDSIGQGQKIKPETKETQSLATLGLNLVASGNLPIAKSKVETDEITNKTIDQKPTPSEASETNIHEVQKSSQFSKTTDAPSLAFLQIRKPVWAYHLSDTFHRIPGVIPRPEPGDTIAIKDPAPAKTWAFATGSQIFYMSKDMRINQQSGVNRVRIENANTLSADRLALSLFVSMEKKMAEHFRIYLRSGLLGLQDKTNFQILQPEILYYQSHADGTGNEVVRPVYRSSQASVLTRQLLATADLGFRYFATRKLGFSVGAGGMLVLLHDHSTQGTSLPAGTKQPWNTSLTGALMVQISPTFYLEPNVVYVFRSQFRPFSNIETRPVLLGLSSRIYW